MRITGGILFVWDVVPSFRNIVSVAASQKNLILVSKKGKRTFVGQDGKRPPWCSSSSQGPRLCQIYDCYGKICHNQGHDLAHLT
jgi:hypothetical protein